MRQISSSQGFTLVELLVVMTITGILVAMLLPAVRAAKDVAQAAACLSNLHGQGVAFGSYTASNNEWFMPTVDYNRAARHLYTEWTDALVEDRYLETRKAYVCPSLELKKGSTLRQDLVYDNPKPATINLGAGVPLPYTGSGIRTRGTSWPGYGYNSAHVGGSDSYTYPTAWNDWSNGTIRTARTTELKYAREGYLTMDSWSYDAASPPSPNQGALWVRDFGYAAGTLPAVIYPNAVMPAPRHANHSVNILYLDFHARSVPIALPDSIDPHVTLLGRAVGGVTPNWDGGRPHS